MSLVRGYVGSSHRAADGSETEIVSDILMDDTESKREIQL